MAKTMSLALSDGLFELRRNLKDAFPSGGIVLDDDQAETLVRLLKELGVMARQLENEVSRHRWNAMAKEDRAAEEQRLTEAVLAEIARPDTNLQLFPIVPRPFGDGRQPA
jgi:hypothetical protein